MRIAVLSDIHGNLEAFEAVLADMETAGVDAVYSLGDNVGYGPDSEAVVRRIRAMDIPSVMGNHELVVADSSHLPWFNPTAQTSSIMTTRMLSGESIAYIRTLPPALTAFGARFVHGFPPDRINTYLFQATESELIEAFTKMAEPYCFVGHTHNLEIIRYDGNQLDYLPLQIGITELSPAFRYILNIGSVGQPRDGNNNAKYIIWNIDDSTVELRFVSYDIAAVVEKIQKAGLPEINAVRLW